VRESVVRDFLEGKAGAQALEAEAAGFLVNLDDCVTGIPVSDLAADFEIQAKHLVLVCDAVLRGSLEAKTLQAIGLFLVASDHFYWDRQSDGAILAGTIHEWAAPEINEPLTPVYVAQCRARLLSDCNET
jgi:rhodanese-related sulfurtransferase